MNKVKLLVALPAIAAALVIGSANAASAASSITVTPSTVLADGQTVTVAGQGFPASTSLFVLECSSPSKEGCDVARLLATQSTADGSFSAKLTVHTGAIGNGTCDSTHPCQVIVSDAGNSATALASLKFAGAAPATTATPASATTTTTPASSTARTTTSSGAGSGESSSQPTSVSAGSGGDADRDGVPTSVIVLTSIAGAAVIGGGGTWLVRRR